VEKADHEDGEDDGADYDVEAIALEGEADDRENHSGDGRGDEQEQAKLDEAATVEVGGEFGDAGDGALIGRLKPEVVEVHWVGVVAGEEGERTDGDEARGDQDSDAEQMTHCGFEAAVVHGR
jgi:hypothetical protein